MTPGISIGGTVSQALGCPAGYVRQNVGGQLVCVPAPSGFNLSALFSQYKNEFLIGGAVLAVLLLTRRQR